jgi:hypothetical protein
MQVKLRVMGDEEIIRTFPATTLVTSAQELSRLSTSRESVHRVIGKGNDG